MLISRDISETVKVRGQDAFAPLQLIRTVLTLLPSKLAMRAAAILKGIVGCSSDCDRHSGQNVPQELGDRVMRLAQVKEQSRVSRCSLHMPELHLQSQDVFLKLHVYVMQWPIQ